MGPYLYFRVLIFTFLASFTQRMSIQSACIQQWFRFKLLANFDFYLCLRINFHTSSFWVLILAAGGPYWVLISQKNGSLLICRQCNSEKLFNLENKLLSINTAVTEFLLVASRAINIRAARKKVQRKPLGF